MISWLLSVKTFYCFVSRLLDKLHFLLDGLHVPMLRGIQGLQVPLLGGLHVPLLGFLHVPLLGGLHVPLLWGLHVPLLWGLHVPLLEGLHVPLLVGPPACSLQFHGFNEGHKVNFQYVPIHYTVHISFSNVELANTGQAEADRLIIEPLPNFTDDIVFFIGNVPHLTLHIFLVTAIYLNLCLVRPKIAVPKYNCKFIGYFTCPKPFKFRPVWAKNTLPQYSKLIRCTYCKWVFLGGVSREGILRITDKWDIAGECTVSVVLTVSYRLD